MCARKILLFAVPFLASSLLAAAEEFQPLHPGSNAIPAAAWRGDAPRPSEPPRNLVRLKLPAVPREESRLRVIDAGEMPGGGLDLGPARPEIQSYVWPENVDVPRIELPAPLNGDGFGPMDGDPFGNHRPARMVDPYGTTLGEGGEPPPSSAAVPGSLRPASEPNPVFALRPPETIGSRPTGPSPAESVQLMELTPFPAWSVESPPWPPVSEAPAAARVELGRQPDKFPLDAFGNYDAPVKWPEFITGAPSHEPAGVRDAGRREEATVDRENRSRPVSRRAKTIGITPVRRLKSALEPFLRTDREE